MSPTSAMPQLHGGAGYMEEYRVARMYTDARVSRIYAGTSEVMREIIASAPSAWTTERCNDGHATRPLWRASRSWRSRAWGRYPSAA